ncbi:integral membrane protein [Fusarium heterosporum]|uniref:Integral membrane protein n=1 Tax=Fusarium heterosporum TaxID=42747 RepID=A0A8H5U2G1_FUSHE|nr:integral membrane protein [Fusarium heterosporum]
MRLISFSLLAVALVAFANAASFADLAAQLPACDLKCVQQAIPKSPCAVTNTTCLCTDQTFAGLTQACVLENCTVKDSLTLMRVQSAACGVPVKSQQMKFRINSLVACILAEIAVILRIYSKVKILGKLGPDDYFIMIAACATVPYIWLACRLADLGFGMNIWDIQPFERLYELLKLFWIDQIMYSVHLYSTKLSILFFLRSIFTTSEFKKLTLLIGIFVALCGAATMITTGLQCLPASYNWTSWDAEHKGHCNDLNSQTYAFGGINMACDIVILILPLPHLWKLQVKGRQKIQLFVMFSLGTVVTVFSIIRLPFLISLGKTSNPTWEYVEVTIWSIWETELGMVCASLPAIRHLFKHLFPNAMATIASKMSFSSSNKDSTHDNVSGSWGSRSTRSKPENKSYYELDERSLIGKGTDPTLNISTTNVHTMA